VRRTKQRQAAVFAIYQSDITTQELNEIEYAKSDTDFSYKLAVAVSERTQELDALIDSHSKNWRIDRIAPLDKAILRVALFEILYGNELDVESPISPEGAIDEAVELAKKFCGEDSPSFINGVLAAAFESVKAGSEPS